MTKVVLVVLAVSCLLFLRCDGFHVQLRVADVEEDLVRTNMTVTCTADEPLTGCQFSFWDVWGNTAGPVLNLSRGPESQAEPTHLYDEELSYSYSGRGLEAGDCGMKLHLFTLTTWLISCRVRAGGGWAYDSTYLTGLGNSLVGKTLLSERLVVALPGGEARFQLRRQGPLDQCLWWVPGPRQFKFNNGSASRDSTGRYRYLGAGLREGECGLTISNVTQEDNGVVSAHVRQDRAWNATFFPLIIARPPARPTLDVDYNNRNITATCRVPDSRPVANITWLLGDKVVRQDSKDDTPGSDQDVWRWQWAGGSTSQSLSLRLGPEDSEKTLQCSVSHAALAEPLVASQVVSLAATAGSATTCPGLVSESLRIVCSFGTQLTNCSETQAVGTVASLRCRPGYTTAQITPKRTACMESGQWSPLLHSCFPDCGRSKTPSGDALISGGSTATVRQFPWHVGIYLAEGSSYTQECGGSLITPKVVLTAGHCFWDFAASEQRNASLYRIAAGKLLRAWDDASPLVQRREVSRVDINLFAGRDRNLGYDIALVFLREPVKISDTVNLVCVDWDNLGEMSQLQAGNVGVVPGWGFTKNGTQQTSSSTWSSLTSPRTRASPPWTDACSRC